MGRRDMTGSPSAARTIAVATASVLSSFVMKPFTPSARASASVSSQLRAVNMTRESSGYW